MRSGAGTDRRTASRYFHFGSDLAVGRNSDDFPLPPKSYPEVSVLILTVSIRCAIFRLEKGTLVRNTTSFFIKVIRKYAAVDCVGEVHDLVVLRPGDPIWYRDSGEDTMELSIRI